MYVSIGRSRCVEKGFVEQGSLRAHFARSSREACPMIETTLIDILVEWFGKSLTLASR